jgi:hypothetical protein
MPKRVTEHGAETRSRSRAFLVLLSGGLMLLSCWWNMAGLAGAASYPPALGCAVSGVATAGSGLLQVQGTGFAAGSRVVVGVNGRSTGAVTADDAGSFRASWLTGGLAAGATVTAADAGCSATGMLAIENQQGGTGGSPLPPATSGPGSGAGQPGPAAPGKRRNAPPAPSPASPKPAPPARPAGPPAAAIPSIPSVPLTGLPPQLVLGLAATVLLAGAALTGLAGRLGHRSEHPVRPDLSMVSAPPTPGAT